MKRCIRYLPIAIFLLLATFGESADRQQSSDSKREVWEALQNYETAFIKRDVAALEKIWADDSVFVNASGEALTKEQNLANIKSGATELDTMIEDGRYDGARLSKQRCHHDPRHDQGAIQWSARERTLPKYTLLGKRSRWLAISL